MHVTAIGDACARHRQGLENAKSLQFQVTVKGGDPEEVALIINTLGEVPPQKVAIADNSCNVGAVGLAVVFQKSVGTNLVSSDAIAAVLGVMMVCGVIAGKRERKSNPSSFAYKSR